MPRKIYDIKPPKLVKKIEKDIKEFLSDDKKPKRRKPLKKEERSFKKPVFVGGLVVLAVVCVYLFFKLPKADIQIWPKVDVLSFQQKITADKSENSINAQKNIIPAKYFEFSKTVTQDFPATGNASNEGRASGTITVYNKFDPPTPLTLKAGTHFVSDSGKLFVAMQKIVVPAAKKSGSKITPGSVQVKIQAVEGGDSYNIAPSNFSVPGLKGTTYYYSIYATSTTAMAGGYAGKVKKVTNDDIQGAKDILVKKATDEAISSLKSQISSDYALLDNALITNVISASTSTKTDAVAENFTYQATVKASALAFLKSDLDKFAKDYIVSQLPEGKMFLDDSFRINYSANTVDISGGKASLNLDFSSGVYQNIDKNSVAISLLGKNSNQISDTISGTFGEQVLKINVDFWPFWVKKAPNSQKAVKVDLKF